MYNEFLIIYNLIIFIFELNATKYKHTLVQDENIILPSSRLIRRGTLVTYKKRLNDGVSTKYFTDNPVREI